MKTGKKTAVIVSAVAAVALLWFVFLRKKEATIEVQTDKPHYGYISESVTATGTVQPVDTVAVGTQVSGTFNKIYADFNSNVKRGELLAELDPSLTKAALLEARANLAEAESNKVYQEKNYNRQNQLYGVGAISKADYDLALNSLNTTKASIKNAEGQVSAALKNLSFTKIYSPINGVVLNRNVNVGQTVAASFSTPTLFSIAKDITHMQVRANVDEADIGNVKKGSRATFTVDAYLDNVFKGNVTEVRLQPTVSANVVTYTTLINAENPDKKLKPGNNNLIGTTESVPVSALPAAAQKKIAKKYPGYDIRHVILFNDNKENTTDMILFGNTFEDEDNYFTELTKGDHDIIVRADRRGEVRLFKKLR
jgi:HlyD family secretion protein